MTIFYIIETGNVIGVRLRKWNDREKQYSPDCFSDMVSAGRFYYNGLGHEVTEKQFINIVSFWQQEVTDINNGIDCPDTFGTYTETMENGDMWRLDIDYLEAADKEFKESCLWRYEQGGSKK